MKYDFRMNARLAKHCPLCGSKNVVTYKREYEEEKNTSGRYYGTIECADCGLSFMGDPADDCRTAYRIALKAWTRRVA